MNDEIEEMQDNRLADIAECYRICRNFQGYGAKAVMRRLKDVFSDKSDAEIAELIVEVQKLARKD